MNGVNITAGSSRVAAAVDLAVALTFPALLVRGYRREAALSGHLSADSCPPDATRTP